MEITLPISSLILIALGAIGTGASIITGVIFIIRKKANERSNYIIAILVILSGFTFLNETLATSGIYNRFQNLYFIPLNFSLAVGPLFYLFIKSKYIRKLSTLDHLHLILPIVQFLFYLFIGFRSVSFKSDLWNNEVFRSFLDVETVLFPLGLLLYSTLSLYLVKKPKSEKYFWDKDVRVWLHRMAYVSLLIAGIELLLFLGEYAFSNRFPAQFYILRSLVFVSLILWFVYNAVNLLYPRSIFKSLPENKSNVLSETETKLIQSGLETLVEKDKIYLNPDLSLGILSKYLDISEKNCSKYFSTVLNTNFNKYINKYRIEAFKEKLKSGEYNNLTLLGIAFESGFDSKSTFNRVFKQMEGLTPTAYKNSLSHS